MNGTPKGPEEAHMKIKALKRLHSRKGESIAETLIALLISSLALVMLAGAISTAGNLIRISETTMENYYSGLNALGSPNTSGLSIEMNDKDGHVYLNTEGTASVEYAVNTGFPNRPVIAYCVNGGTT